MTSVFMPQVVHGTRAVRRPVLQGSTVICSGCATVVKYTAKARSHQVIANVYADGRWNRVEHYHPECYASSGEPHGAVRE